MGGLPVSFVYLHAVVWKPMFICSVGALGPSISRFTDRGAVQALFNHIVLAYLNNLLNLDGFFSLVRFSFSPLRSVVYWLVRF